MCLEAFEVIEKCSCFSEYKENYCEICKGARYKISSYLSVDEVKEVSIFLNAAQDTEVQEKLQKGLKKLLEEM